MSWEKRRAPARTRHNARWAATSVLLALLGILVVVALPMTAVGAGGSPAANLDQCGNDPATSSPAARCSGATGETGWVWVDDTGRTSVPGVWAAGNAVNPRAQVITAAGEGSAAAIAINNDLVDEDTQTAVSRCRLGVPL